MIAAVQKARVLVVDDYPGARYRRMRILLDDGHYEVAEEILGRDAVRRAADERIDLVLADLHLPDISGIEVCQAIRANPRTATLPVLIISADAEREEAARLAREAGANAFLPDTLEQSALLDELRRALAARPAQP